MKRIYKLVFLVMLVIVSVKVYSEHEHGKIFIKNYISQDYNAFIQNWCIVQDDRGLLYFANGDGVLQFDGKYWNLITLENKSTVRSLAKDKQGKIYVGGSGVIGCLGPNSIGEMQFKSLSNLIPDSIIYADVWQISVINNYVIFRSADYIFVLHNNKINVVPTETKYSKALVIDQEYYILQREIGLTKLDFNTHTFINTPPELKSLYYRFGINMNNNEIIYYNRVDGLMKVKVLSNEINRKFIIEKIDIPELMNISFKHGTKIDENTIAMCTSGLGVYIVDLKKHTFTIINEKSGLANAFVPFVYVDRQKNLWMALNNGIACAYISSPITYWNYKSGLHGIVNDIQRYDDKLFLATHQGLKYLHNNNIVKVNGIRGQIWDLLILNSALNGQELYASTNNGIYKINEQNSERIVKSRTTFIMYQSKVDTTKILLGIKDGLVEAKYIDGQWISFNKFPDLNYSIRSIAEDSSENVWLSSYRDGVIQIKNLYDSSKETEIIKYDTADGLPSLKDLYIFPFQNYLVFGTEFGIYKYNPKQRRFVSDTIFGTKFTNGSNDVYCLLEDDQQNVWISGLISKSGKIAVGKIIPDKTIKWNYKPFKYLPQMMIFSIFNDNNKKTWIGGSDGLFLINSDIISTEYHHFNTLIRKVTTSDDSVLFGGEMYNILNNQKHMMKGTSLNSQTILGYENNNITFYYSATSYIQNERNEFQYKLDGFDKKWSKWSKDSYKKYTNLQENSYCFRLKAQNLFNEESSEVHYYFEILPPFYRTWYAYLFYVIISMLIIYIVTVVYSRNLRHRNLMLEKLVRVRTSEIGQQKEELRMQAEHLVTVNLELEKLSIVAKETDNAVLIMDKNGYFEWINEGFTRMYGYDFIELQNVRSNNIYNGSDNNEIREKLDLCIKTKQSVVYDLLTIKKNGKKFWTQTTLTPILNEDNEIIKLVAIDTDITLLKDAEFEILQQKSEIETQRDKIGNQRDEIEKKRDIALKQRDELILVNKEIIDSIHYAYRIQKAILPKTKYINSVLNNYFIFNKPKGIVSGDFYFVYRKNDCLIIAVGDCTGHGVPGALLSMLGLTFLNKIVKDDGIETPGEILIKLREYMVSSLNQNTASEELFDGIDISVVQFNTKCNELSFAGANNSCIIINNDELIEMIPDKMTIAIDGKDDIPFKTQKIQLKGDETIYLYTDGYIDQFGGEKNKKFMMHRFKKLLQLICPLPFTEQSEKLSKNFDNWSHKGEQVDDILVIGFNLVNNKNVI